MFNRFLLLFFLLLFLLGCDDSSVVMDLIVYDETSDSFKIDEAVITTLDDITALKGEAGEIIGSAEMKLDYFKDSRGILSWEDGGKYVAFSAFKRDGVYIPEDFDSLAMATIYFNVERSMLFYEEVGLSREITRDLDIYYHPKFIQIDSQGEKTALTDNAFYMSEPSNSRNLFSSLVILPFDDFQWLPLALNAGITTHEYTHYVFDMLVIAPNWYRISNSTYAAYNYLHEVNEGLADFMAVAAMNDPDYISHSIPKNTYMLLCASGVHDLVRDATRTVNFNVNMDIAAQNADMSCPYEIAQFLESLLYEIAVDVEGQPVPSREALEKTAKWVLQALVELGRVEGSIRNFPLEFKIWHFLNYFVSQIEDPEEKNTACDVIELRYNLHFEEVNACS